MSDQAANGILRGVRVLDLADESAVFGTKLLSDLGAEVLRVEPPDGDSLRRLAPFAGDTGHPEDSLSHWWFNSGKRSAVLDLATNEGRRRLAELAGTADVVIETAGSGLDVTALHAVHPALTIVSVSGMGRSGPRRDWQASDLIAWALGGAMFVTGLPDRPPLYANWLLASQITGLYAAAGALAGLYLQRATGRGALFDLSSVESVASVHETLFGYYVYLNGRLQDRQGLGSLSSAPYGDFPTRDGQVVMAVLTQAQWRTLLDWMDESGSVEPWARDEALLTVNARAQQRPRVHEFVGKWSRRFLRADLVREANRRRIPCAPINTPAEVLEDEQLLARGFFHRVEQPRLGRAATVPGCPYRFAGQAPIRPAPSLGADAPEFLGPPPGPPRHAPRQPALGSAPLTGVRILDLTWALAGPMGVRVLADLGAETVKVEARGVGDIFRGFPPHFGGRFDLNQAAVFQRLQRNKRNLTVDLKKPAGLDLVKRLAAWTDVVIDNFGAGVTERLGLGPAALRAINPALIQVSLSGYGQTGPTRHYPSFASISQARGGLTYCTAYEDGVITGPGIGIGDSAAGLHLTVIVLAALENRTRTGDGLFIDLSQLESVISLVGTPILDAAVNHRSFTPRGNLLPDRAAAPHGVYPAAGDERWIAIAVMAEDQWPALCQEMGHPDLAADPRFATAADRIGNCVALDETVGAWTRGQEAHALAERLQAAGVPAGVVQNAQDIIEKDPHLRARGFLQSVEQPEIGPVLMDTTPLRWSDSPAPIHRPAPLIGEHNEAVLTEVLGLSEEEIVALVIDEVI